MSDLGKDRARNIDGLEKKMKVYRHVELGLDSLLGSDERSRLWTETNLLVGGLGTCFAE